MKNKPAFIRGFQSEGEYEELHKDFNYGFTIFRRGSTVTLSLETDWTKEIGVLAHRFGVNSVYVARDKYWNRKTLDFLSELRPLKRISLCLDEALDISIIEEFSELSSLSIVWRSRLNPPPIDFHKFKGLDECWITLRPEFESILGNRRLHTLVIEGDTYTHSLNLTNLSELKDLNLVTCQKMIEFRVNESAKISSLEIMSSPKLSLDWKLFSPNLQYLCLGGKLGFEISQISCLDNLEFLDLREVSKPGSLEFLSSMKSIKCVRLIDLRATKEMVSVAKAINFAGGYGSVAMANPFG